MMQRLELDHIDRCIVLGVQRKKGKAERQRCELAGRWWPESGLETNPCFDSLRGMWQAYEKENSVS